VKKIIALLLPFFPLSFLLLLGFIDSATKEIDMEDSQEDDERFIRIAIVEDKAYWVINNVLYQADIVDGEIEKEYASPVDAFDIDFREVSKLMSILDSMQDWKN
jgi:hypothetical protein